MACIYKPNGLMFSGFLAIAFGCDMTVTIKKLLLALFVSAVLGAMSNSAASSSVSRVSGNEYAYFDGSTTTYWDLSTVTAWYPNVLGVLQTQPWWGSSANANLFAVAVAGNLGYPNYVSNDFYTGTYSPYFAYQGSYAPQTASSIAFVMTGGPYSLGSAQAGAGGSQTYAVATAHVNAVPEIDGALIPQVGLLIVGLFIILGRRKENTESMLAV